MLHNTPPAIGAMLKADTYIQAHDRADILAAIKNSGKTAARTAAPGNRVLKRREVAERLGVCPRTVDGLSRSGALRRVILPGRQRGAGYSEADVVRLIEQAAAANEGSN
mgnify:CR=1 FL=1